jgi:DNA-binding MarR family transcriptional regulator
LEDLQQVFEELGLTPKQAVILLFLSKLDLASVKEISKSARVHRQEVYPALLELQKLGLVEKKIGLPQSIQGCPACAGNKYLA